MKILRKGHKEMHVLDVSLHFIEPQQSKKIKTQIKTEFTKLQV